MLLNLGCCVQLVGLGDEEDGSLNGDVGVLVDARPKESLLVTAVRARRGMPEESEAEKRLKEEREMLKQITTKQALKSVGELAKVGCASCYVSGTMPALKLACDWCGYNSCMGVWVRYKSFVMFRM